MATPTATAATRTSGDEMPIISIPLLDLARNRKKREK
jgi:hypothetical protein